MTGPLTACVLDASVAVKAFLDEEGTAEALRLFAAQADDPPLSLHVPDFFFVECANVLWKAVRGFRHPPAKAAEDLEDLLLMELAVVAVRSLLPAAYRIASSYDVSVYDACYVATADALGLPLVTADERLIRRFEGTAHDVRGVVGAPRPS